MQLEDYFDFQRPDDIRVKGTRIGIETILYDFIHRARTPEKIAQIKRLYLLIIFRSFFLLTIKFQSQLF